jgi:hypothetical protein
MGAGWNKAALGFEDTELGAFGAALDWNPAIARAFSLLRHLSPGGACQIFLKAGNALMSPVPSLGLGGGIEPPRQQ